MNFLLERGDGVTKRLRRENKELRELLLRIVEDEYLYEDSREEAEQLLNRHKILREIPEDARSAQEAMEKLDKLRVEAEAACEVAQTALREAMEAEKRIT